ncbi:MAG: M23 family metallopeptidase [Candidatus Moduliflexus flocculans]|nr:M23 family metallopeptidase [Candidatus Moduliflexus flocculans]
MGMISFYGNEDVLERILAHPLVGIGADSRGRRSLRPPEQGQAPSRAPTGPSRASSASTSANEKIVPLEEMIRKMTAMPAAQHGLRPPRPAQGRLGRRRLRLRSGPRSSTRPRSRSRPSIPRASVQVVVNGQVVVDDGRAHRPAAGPGVEEERARGGGVIRPTAAGASGRARSRAALVALGRAAPAAAGRARSGARHSGSAGPVVRLAYRALQPGEPLLVFLEDDGTVRSAPVSFLGRTAELRPTGSSRTANPRDRVFALPGDRRPGQAGPCRPDRQDRARRAGSSRTSARTSSSSRRKFPSTKLTFDPNYVTPPASVQARIKRESELVALATSVVTPEWLGDGPFAASPRRAVLVELRPAAAEQQRPAVAPHGPRPARPLRRAHPGRQRRHGGPGQRPLSRRQDRHHRPRPGRLQLLRPHVRAPRQEGEAVRKGQTVGLCGTTGRSTGPASPLVGSGSSTPASTPRPCSACRSREHISACVRV